MRALAHGALRVVVAAIGVTVTLVVALVAALLLHLNIPPLRRSIAAEVDAALASSFQGRVAIDSVGGIEAGGASGGIYEGNARVLDPSGAVVAAAYGVRAHIDLKTLARSLLGGAGPIAIHLTDVSVRAVDLDIARDASGKLGVERAFAPRSPSSGPPGRGATVTIDRIEVAHAWVHGSPVSGLPVDADVDALRASLAVGPKHVKVDAAGFSLATRGMPLRADARGTGEAHLVLPAPSGGAIGARVAWNGTVAGIAETASASLDGDALEAVVDAPDVEPAPVRALWPASPIDGVVTVHVDARGPLSRLEVHARATHGDHTIDVTGPVVLGAGQSADLHLEAKSIDVHTFVSSAPSSNLSLSGDVSVARSAAGMVNGKASIDVATGSIAGARVPSGKIRATFSHDPAKGAKAEATVSANEPGAPTALAIRVAPKGKSYEITFDGDTHVPALDAVPRLGKQARGRTDLKTHGVIDFGRGEMDVQLAAQLEGVGHDVLSAEHASVTAQIHGTLAAPRMDVTVHGDVLDFGGYKFSAAQVEVHGPSSGADVHASLDADGDGTPDLSLDGTLSLAGGAKVEEVHVHVARARESVAVHVGEIKIAHGEISVDPIEIDGLGGPIQASFVSTLGVAHVQVHGDGVDLARFERVSRVEEGLGGCVAALDVDTFLRRDGADGHASIELTKCAVEGITGGSAGLAATFQGRKIAGRAHAEIEDVGSFTLTSPDIQVGGTGTVLESWKKAWGRVRFEGKVDVAKLAAKLPRQSVQLDHVRGVIAMQGRVQRDSPTDDTPGLNLSISTSGLVLVGPSSRTTGVDGSPAIAPPAWRMEGIDLGVDARIDGDSGFAAVAARVTDPRGQLVAVDLKSGAVPYGALLDTPRRALTLLEDVPFNARVVIPPRDLKTLPPLLALKGIRGTLEADLTATGPLVTPVVDVRAKVTKGHAQSAVAFPIDLDVAAHYDGAHLDATLLGMAKGAQVLDAHVAADARAPDLLHGDFSQWTASGRAHMNTLELQTIAALSDRQVTGKVTGDLSIDGLHKDARATFALEVGALKVGDVVYPSGAIKVSLDGKALDASLHLNQTDGSLAVNAQAPSKWGWALLPTVDAASLTGGVKATRFRAAFFLPFVDNVFTELDGRIDADMKLGVDAKTVRPQLAGTVVASQGRFELASMGGEFHDVGAKASFTRDGVVKIEDVKASAMSGKVEAAASGRMNGFSLTAANATIAIPQSSPLLLTVEGAQVGTVEGSVTVAVSSTTTATNVKVEVPRLHVELPLTSTRDVQALGDMEGVRIGLEKKGGAFEAERLDAPKEPIAAPPGKSIVTTIALGSDVVVKKSTELSVSLTGTPTIAIASDVRATGQVRLVRGKIDVQGKTFDIDSGAVTFMGDITDPQVVVSASWTAADGTHVYADLRGTLKSPKVTLRSEPAYSQNEIIALLVSGSVDATNPSSQNNGAAAGVAGGAATQPLNRALENMGLGGISTRVDTSAVTPRADVEFQIARDLSLQIAEVMGVPPPGTNQDTTLLTVNYRFAKAWSAQATFGSAGTTIWDMIWQYRY